MINLTERKLIWRTALHSPRIVPGKMESFSQFPKRSSWEESENEELLPNPREKLGVNLYWSELSASTSLMSYVDGRQR
jgi:hypothetical protein